MVVAVLRKLAAEHTIGDHVWTAPGAHEGFSAVASASAGCLHVCGPFAQHLRLLALMKSADRFPNRVIVLEALRSLGLAWSMSEDARFVRR
jgi:hypothetical protein